MISEAMICDSLRSSTRSKCSSASSINNISEHRCLVDYSGVLPPRLAKIYISCEGKSWCSSDLEEINRESFQYERRRLTVLESITYHAASSVVSLDAAVIAPPPLLAMVHSPNQAAASPKYSRQPLPCSNWNSTIYLILHKVCLGTHINHMRSSLVDFHWQSRHQLELLRHTYSWSRCCKR